MADVKKTGPHTHIATERGYAVPEGGAGELVEAGEFVPANTPLGAWMEKAKGDHAAQAAIDDAEESIDVDYTQHTVVSLQAIAAERGINIEQDGKRLTKTQLIDAIKGVPAHDAG